MKIRFKSLQLHFRRSAETITFEHVNFFWGKIGAGKTSIAKLVDYCLGGSIQLTPALQLEFNSATLSLEVAARPLTIYRERDSSNVVAAWDEGDGQIEVLMPARKAEGIVVPGTSIEVLSDLIFHIAGIPAPRVRKGRRTPDERLERLSLRDLLKYCYLDQDTIDSDFFRLDDEGDFVRRAKSADTMRFILGYHQDQVAQLESELQDAREQRLAAKAAADALSKVLSDAGFVNPTEIDARIGSLQQEAEKARSAALATRVQRDSGGHAVDVLRERARSLAREVGTLENMRDEVATRSSSIERHLNELKMLSVRYGRTKAARAVLGAVDFSACPRCTQTLPTREEHLCPVCGQEDVDARHEHLSDEVLSADLKARLSELQETLTGLTTQGRKIDRELQTRTAEKSSVEREFSERMRDYDSAFLSQALTYERHIAMLEQQINSLASYRKLPERLDELHKKAHSLQGEEAKIRTALATAREKAFADRTNLRKLEAYFLECLLRSSYPGIDKTYKVSISPKTFIPEVMPTEAEDFAVTSFANMSSGGMKTIFKACYAVALHRLATETGAALPSVLILDSAMKNVSERENRELFQAFYRMVYELAVDEMSDTQFILIDKEYYPVPQDINLKVKTRHMAPGSSIDRPLIPYYNVPEPDEPANN